MKRLLALIALAAAIVLTIAVVGALLGAAGFGIILPLSLVAAVVIVHRYSPLPAALLGTAITLAIIFAVVFPFITWTAVNGDFGNTSTCDGFCMTNSEGFFFATFILIIVAVPTSLAAGVVSFIASLLTPHRSRTA